jgi:TonB family protein
MLQLAFLLPCLFILASIAEAETACDFAEYKPMRMSHFDRLATDKVEPQYPHAARAKGIAGTVRVKVLVNRDGFVEKACAMHISGEPEPDQRLTTAAVAAALQWKFQPNFGITVIGELKVNYVEGILNFAFVIQQDEKK